MPPRIPTPSPYTHCTSCLNLARSFSSTPTSRTRLRQKMFAWLNTYGEIYRDPKSGRTNYLKGFGAPSKAAPARPENAGELSRETISSAGDDIPDAVAKLKEAAVDDVPTSKPRNEEPLLPFPQNPHFISQPALSEALRLEVWKRVQVDKKSVRQVSVELGIEMRRVGAVVRLVEIEKKMRAENKHLALPYARAIQSMVPTTLLTNPPTPHEPINDLPHHTLTNPQLFYPTSESRAFNRVDAGRVFSGAPRLPDSQDVGQGGTPPREAWEDTTVEWVGKDSRLRGKHHQKGWGVGFQEMQVLKPADARIPHGHLIAHEQDRLALEQSAEADGSAPKSESDVQKRYLARLRRDEENRGKEKELRRKKEEARKTRVDTERWEFVFTDVKTDVSGTGKDGRGTRAPGRRYGVPSMERKRGVVKIPTKVEV